MNDTRIATKEQAKMLLDVKWQPVLALLTAQPHSIHEVGTVLQLKSNRAQYLVTCLAKAGLAEVVEVQPRAGRAIRRYAVMGKWFIPFQVTEACTLEQLGRDLSLPLIEKMLHDAALNFRDHTEAQSGYWWQGGHLRLGDCAGPYQDLAFQEEPFLLHFVQLKLTHEKASSLAANLLGLLQEYEAQQSEEAPTFSLGLMLVRENAARSDKDSGPSVMQ